MAVFDMHSTLVHERVILLERQLLALVRRELEVCARHVHVRLTPHILVNILLPHVIIRIRTAKIVFAILISTTSAANLNLAAAVLPRLVTLHILKLLINCGS